MNIVNLLAKLEGRSSSALMRELLTLGLAQYVNIHYRTPQLIREQQLQSIINKQLSQAASQAKAAQKKMLRICHAAVVGENRDVVPETFLSLTFPSWALGLLEES